MNISFMDVVLFWATGVVCLVWASVSRLCLSGEVVLLLIVHGLTLGILGSVLFCMLCHMHVVLADGPLSLWGELCLCPFVLHIRFQV